MKWESGERVPGDELVEHVDDDGNVLTVVPRSRMRTENLLHRSVAIVVTGADGRLLVHRRADDKDVYPGWWDLAAGGVVGVGESFESAARRELAEELGIDAEPVPIGTGRFDDEHAREICRVFAVVHDGPFRFDDGEVAEARFVTPAELAELVAAERFLPGGLRIVAPLIDGFADVAHRVPCTTVQRVEFTVEPFVEGLPGRHVTAPLEAVRALGIAVDFGPFGSACVTETNQVGAVVAAVVETALAHGATHVNVDVTAVEAGSSS